MNLDSTPFPYQLLKMKQLLFLNAMILALSATANTNIMPTPYSSTLFEDTAWKVVNINPNSKTWEDSNDYFDFRYSGYESGKYYKYDRYNNADDWLISPAIQLTAGKEYKVMFIAQATSDYEQFRLTMATDTAVASHSLPESVLWEYNGNTTDWQKISRVIRPDKDQIVHFGIHAYSEANMNKIYVTGFEVKENVFIPSGVSSLSVTPDLDGAIRATLSWVLPTHDVDNSPIPEDAVFNKVSLWRDGELLAELPGSAVSYIDSEETGLTPGQHTYNVSVTINGVESQRMEVTSRYIGPIPAKNLPWVAGIKDMKDETFATEFLVIKGKNSGVKKTNGWMLKAGTIDFYPGSSYVQEDDWLVLPKVKFETPGVYRLVARSSYEGNNPAIEVRMGKNRTVEDLSQILGSFTDISSEVSNLSVTFNVKEPGEYYLALYTAREEAGNSKRIKFHELTIEEGSIHPMPVSDLAVQIEGESVRLSWTASSQDNTGNTIDSLDKVELFRDGVLLETFGDIKGGMAMEYIDTPSAGVHSYTVVPYLDGLAPEGNPVSITTSWVGDRLCEIPYEVDFSKSVNQEELAALWQTVNRDKDTYKWAIGTSSFNLTLDEDGGYADDLLITPPFEFTPGIYKVELSACGAESGFPLRIGFITENDENYNLQNSSVIELNGKKSTKKEYSVELEVGVSERGCIVIATDPEYEYDWDLYPISITRFAISQGEVSFHESPYQPADFSEWKIFNVNDDYEMDGLTPTSWFAEENIIRIDSPFEGTDDWAISPQIRLEAGKTYEISFTINDFSQGSVMEVHCGNSSSPDAMDTPLHEVTEKGHVSFKVSTSPTSSKVARATSEDIKLLPGYRTFGFHASDKGLAASISNFSVVESSPMTGVDDIWVEGSKDLDFYDLNGLRVAHPVKGSIYLVRTTDGKVRKVKY